MTVPDRFRRVPAGPGFPARAGVAVTTAALAAVLTACSGPVATPPTPPPPAAAAGSVALPSSLGGPGGTWATVAMGQLSDPANTFWQLLHLARSSGRWAVTTPPGVATNGGLVAGVARSGALVSGVEPADGLHFSPVAATVDAGTSWTGGVLPAGLAPVPDAMATSTAGRTLALLRTGGGRVVTSVDGLTSWSTLVSLGALAADPAVSGCRPEALTSVAVLAGEVPAIGVACARGPRASVVVEESGEWRESGPPLPSGTVGRSRVVRLVATPTGAAALVSTGSGRHAALVGAWSTDGLATWTTSTPLATPNGALVSSGTTPDGGFVVVTRAPHGTEVAASVAASSASWRGLPTPPTGTGLVAATPDGGFDALVVHRSTLRVEALGGKGWSLTQTLQVPIQYGSSN